MVASLIMPLSFILSSKLMIIGYVGHASDFSLPHTCASMDSIKSVIKGDRNLPGMNLLGLSRVSSVSPLKIEPQRMNNLLSTDNDNASVIHVIIGINYYSIHDSSGRSSDSYVP